MSRQLDHDDLIDQARGGTVMRSAPALRMSGKPPTRIGRLNVSDVTARRWGDRVVVELTVVDDAQWAQHVRDAGAVDTVDGDQVVTPEAARIALSGCKVRLSVGESELRPWRCGFGGTGTERTADWTFIVSADAAVGDCRLKIASETTDTEMAIHF